MNTTELVPIDKISPIHFGVPPPYTEQAWNFARWYAGEKDHKIIAKESTIKALDNYLESLEQIYEYFGYTETWKVCPIDDAREYFWKIDDKKTLVYFAETLADFLSKDYYDNEILPHTTNQRSIYRKNAYTMIHVDTHTDGNVFLQIFDNNKEIK